MPRAQEAARPEPRRRLSPVSLLRRSLGRVRDDVHRFALSDTAREVLRRHLTYLSPRKLRSLELCAEEVNQRDVDGDFIECGVALGGSAIVLASHLEYGRHLHGYDVFGLIPPPSERDDEHAHQRYETIRKGQSAGIGGDVYYGYVDDLRTQVVDNFRLFGFEPDGRPIALHEGLFEDTLRLDLNQRVALAHIDCDWYDPVAFCLAALYPHLSPGGFIILDDYNDYGGCRHATDEFLAQHADLELRTTAGHAVLCRVRT